MSPMTSERQLPLERTRPLNPTEDLHSSVINEHDPQSIAVVMGPMAPVPSLPNVSWVSNSYVLNWDPQQYFPSRPKAEKKYPTEVFLNPFVKCLAKCLPITVCNGFVSDTFP